MHAKLNDLLIPNASNLTISLTLKTKAVTKCDSIRLEKIVRKREKCYLIIITFSVTQYRLISYATFIAQGLSRVYYSFLFMRHSGW